MKEYLVEVHGTRTASNTFNIARGVASILANCFNRTTFVTDVSNIDFISDEDRLIALTDGKYRDIFNIQVSSEAPLDDVRRFFASGFQDHKVDVKPFTP
ncbi:MAG: hypothetical protein JWO78_1633 [Micavibrio sp.]|nr:hypothetical protein [Micavibrio sp.]